MSRVNRVSLSVVAVIISLLFAQERALAGPPLLCHPIEIGKAESLPWGNAAWDNKKIKSSDVEFVKQTLALLLPETPTLVRMETIRRATIYVAEHPNAAGTLLATVRGRVMRTDTLSTSHAYSLFDLGYLIACYSQMNPVTDNESRGFDGGTRQALVVPEDLRPIDILNKSAALAPNDAAIEFALALVTSFPEDTSHRDHVQRAVAGATDGTLLAVNVMKHFGLKGQTLADLRTSFGIMRMQSVVDLTWPAGHLQEMSTSAAATAHNDAHSVALARSGDREAFARLHRAYSSMVHGILLARVPRGEVDDLVQDVFMLAMQRIHSLRDENAFGGWLATIARNRATDFHRQKRDDMELMEETAFDPSSHNDSEAAHVLLLVRSLPEAYRETLVLRLVEGMTGPEIAERTGLTPGSVRVNLHRGIQMLREKLGWAQ